MSCTTFRKLRPSKLRALQLVASSWQGVGRVRSWEGLARYLGRLPRVRYLVLVAPPGWQSFHESMLVSGKAGWFQEVPGCFRKAWVVSGKAMCFMKDWVVVSGKVWWCQESLGWLQERLRGFREGCVVAGKTGCWFQGRL